MFPVARTDDDRASIESFAMVALMRAAYAYGMDVVDTCALTGMRSATFRVEGWTVRLSYPIWFAADGEQVSWQAEVTDPAGAHHTLMTGVPLDGPAEHMFSLLFAINDPTRLAQACALAADGDDPAAVLCSPPVPGPA